jgi:hypothetical protein
LSANLDAAIFVALLVYPEPWKICMVLIFSVLWAFPSGKCRLVIFLLNWKRISLFVFNLILIYYLSEEDVRLHVIYHLFRVFGNSFDKLNLKPKSIIWV